MHSVSSPSGYEKPSSTLWLVPPVVLIICLALTYFFYRHQMEDQRQHLLQVLDERAKHSVARIEKRLHSYQQILEDTASLLMLKPDLDDRAFKAHVDRLQLENRFPGTLGLSFTRALTKANLEAYLAQQRISRPWFDIHPPPGKRESLAVVTFIEPLTLQNRKILGFDTSVEQERAALLVHTRDQSQLMVSGVILLVQDQDGKPSPAVLITAPVYAYGAVLDTVEARRRHLLGWSNASLRISDFIHGVLGEDVSASSSRLLIRLFDVDAGGKTALLFENDLPDNTRPDTNARQKTVDIPFAGRIWRVEFTTLPSFDKHAGHHWPHETAILGTLGSILLACVLWLVIHGRNNALRLSWRATQELRQSKELFQAVIEGSNDGIFVKDVDGRFLMANSTLKRWLGQELTPGRIEYIDHELVSPEELASIRAEERQIMRAQQIVTKEQEVRTHDGQLRTLLVTKGPFKTADGEVSGVFGIARDITERKRIEAQLELAACVFQAGTEGVVVCDLDNRIISVNQAFTELTGYAPEEALGRLISILHSGRQDADFYQLMWRSINSTGKWEGELWNRRKNGEIFPEYLRINTLYDKDGQPSRRFGIFSDITEQKKAQDQIWQQANYDALTELPNRRMFRDRLQQEIRRAHRNASMLAILFIDLDHFKDVNDSFGHDQGDLLLVEAARRIQACVRESDIVARMGGDEFIVVLPDLTEISQVTRVAQNLLNTLGQTFQLPRGNAHVSGSIGITIYPHDAEDEITLIQNADQAMYASKTQGRNNFSFFTQTMQSQAQQRMHLATELRQALADNQLSLHIQPITRPGQARPLKAEALLRWHHPELGNVPPARFIPIAEETGLIIEIGDWVFRQAADFLRRWQEQHRRYAPSSEQLPQIGINLSPQQLLGSSDMQAWVRYLEAIDLPPDSIVIEITESLLLERNPCVLEKLAQLRNAGIKLSLDDFGTGYSSMAYLKKFEVDFLKIDRSFILDMENNTNDQAIVEAVILMAHKLGISVIGEGVENEGQQQILLDSRCDFLQGYLFSRPIPEAEFLERFASA